MELSTAHSCNVEFTESDGLLIALFAGEEEAVVYDATHCTLSVVEIVQQQHQTTTAAESPRNSDCPP